jgi:DNA-binding protein H-NS
MEKLDLAAMALDDLWALHEKISNILSARIIAEKRQLENRLVQLNRGKSAPESVPPDLKSSERNRERPRRTYPRVFPKYQNPTVPSETWSGRGKRPRWLVSALKAGGAIEDFKIPASTQTKVGVPRY